ncbi:hypothetical protein FKW77_008569 [Venturia effusa]|uniref:Luciferase-like domain-containing protein n=1 Tax=Venturia effusa TaxID=50376 RepID=A0A517LCS3_9PEZI|nr:hypothetical protein FKW77_008569 [Venturia effusa]
MTTGNGSTRTATAEGAKLEEHGTNGMTSETASPASTTNGKRKSTTTPAPSSPSPKKALLASTDPLQRSPKQWIINAFAMQAPCHLNPGLHNHPLNKHHKYNSINSWISLARKLEEAKFHAIFFADVLGGYDVYKGPANLEPTIPAGVQFPILDPLYAVAALAASTRSIGFGITASTTYDAPYALARRFSTVDHLSNGRVGWNIVTSYLDSAARNFNLSTQIEHDERYAIAHEYLHVVYKLWEGSWRDDAVNVDVSASGEDENVDVSTNEAVENSKGNDPKKAKGAYANPKAVRQINHTGKYFKVPGPHLCEPSPQRTPFLFQAGTSSKGKEFAATHAEAIFLNGHTPDLIAPSVTSIRAAATSLGRTGSDLKIITGILVIVAPTDEAAHAKFADLVSYGDREGALALFGGWSGYDLNQYGDDDDFRFLDEAPPAVRSMVNHWAAADPLEGRVWNKKTIGEYLVLGGNGAKIIGSPTRVADELQRWVDVAGVDGFNFSYATVPGTFEDIITYLLPELRRRGVFWHDYAVPGGTLRENYFGQEGKKRLADSHPGARYFWKAGEEVPEYAREVGEGDGEV